VWSFRGMIIVTEEHM